METIQGLTKDGEIEVFCDPAYFGLYAVKYIDNKNFKDVWHFIDKEDADRFKELLSKAK